MFLFQFVFHYCYNPIDNIGKMLKPKGKMQTFISLFAFFLLNFL